MGRFESLSTFVMTECSEWTNLKSFVATESCSVGMAGMVVFKALPCVT